jgi:hypothetical protein
MWLNDLGNLYTEGWGPGTPNLPGDARGMLPARETKDSIKMKGVFSAGDSPSNMLSVSQASGQNPFEQEEDKALSKSNVLNLIDAAMADLDKHNNQDALALLVLGTLRKKVRSL